MIVSSGHIERVVARYLAVFPEEQDRLRPLLSSQAERAESFASRKDEVGHVTCGVALIRRGGHVLTIRHRALERWLLPGGHLDANDISLEDAALRELMEECGVTPRGLIALGPAPGVPFDIDVHCIPACEARDEAEHFHYDFRFAFGLDMESAVRLQLDEVEDFAWVTFDELGDKNLGSKLRSTARAA